MWAHGWHLLKEYDGVIGVSRKLIKPHICNFQKQQTAAAPLCGQNKSASDQKRFQHLNTSIRAKHM
jgi:hypothetical protein